MLALKVNCDKCNWAEEIKINMINTPNSDSALKELQGTGKIKIVDGKVLCKQCIEEYNKLRSKAYLIEEELIGKFWSEKIERIF